VVALAAGYRAAGQHAGAVGLSYGDSRVLKPLLEALTTVGSGRLEIIRDAYERGAFQDLRLIAPALAALDDTYAEIGDLVITTRRSLPRW
jgi:hypothetical protein